jgi:BolA protein
MIEQQLKELLTKNIDCHYLRVVNESHLHNGHAGSPGTGQSHFEVFVVSDDFSNQSKVGRHSMVLKTVNHLFKEGLHALSIKVFTIKEYKSM